MFAHPRAPGHMRRALSLVVITSLATSPLGCDQPQAPASIAHAEEAEPIVESHTVYTDQIEHFDEHPPLVAGRPTKFAAHATDIRADFKSIREGTMTVVALRDGKVVAESPPAKNSRPGIFGPVITIPSAGAVEIRMRLETPGIRDEASLGEVMVHASDTDAARAHTGAEEGGGEEPIAFLKEQQWKIEFRNEAATRRRLVETLRVPGQVVSRPGCRAIVAAPASGLTLPPAEGGFPGLGDRVEAGQSVGTIAPVLGGVEGTQLVATRAELEVKALEVETEVARARMRLARAERLRERAERLRKSGAVSERELEDARFDAELAAAEVTATARLLEPYDAVRRARAAGSGPLSVVLKAPISGTIAMARATPGEYVEAGRALFEIVDLARIWIEGEVPEPDLARLPLQPTATCVPASVPGGAPRAQELTFVALSPVVDPEMRSTRIVYSGENESGALRIGAAVDLVIETAHAEEALTIPDTAIVDEDGRAVVFVQVEGEAFERRELTLGLRSQGLVQVLAGLEPGERVVTKGAYAVRLQSVSTTIPAHGHAH